MEDVFLSFAPEDRELADHLAWSLHSLGKSVWMDASVEQNQRFPEIWADELKTASTVVVLWTGKALQSPIVNAEAREGAATGRLINVIYDTEVKADNLPVKFIEFPILAIDDETDDFKPIADYVKSVASKAKSTTPKWTGKTEDDTAALATKLVAQASADPNADWNGFQKGRADGIEDKQSAAFAAAARKLANAPESAWREAFAAYARGESRLAAIYRLEQLCAKDNAGMDWRRAIGDLAWPYFPIRTIGGSYVAGTPSHEMDALTAPYPSATIRVARSGVAKPGKSKAKTADDGENMFGGMFWLVSVIAAAGLLLFVINEFSSDQTEASGESRTGATPTSASAPSTDANTGEPAALSGANPAASQTSPSPSEDELEAAEVAAAAAIAAAAAEAAEREAAAEKAAAEEAEAARLAAEERAADERSAAVVATRSSAESPGQDGGDDDLSLARQAGMFIREFDAGECTLDEAATHTAAKGESLWVIAETYYGPNCGARAANIYIASQSVFTPKSGKGAIWRQVNNPDLLYPGETLVIPAIT